MDPVQQQQDNENTNNDPTPLYKDIIIKSLCTYRDKWLRFYNTFGWKFLIVASLIEHIIQGFVFAGGKSGFIGSPIAFIFRDFHLTAGRIQILKTIAVSPWALKPLMGIISDTVYIYGYRKLPYIILTTLGAICSCLVITFFYPSSPIGLTILFFFIFLQIALSDLLVEAKYAEKTKKDPTLSPEVVSFVHIGGFIFQAISIVTVGSILEYIPYQFIYAIPIPIFVIYLCPIIFNWINDKRVKLAIYDAFEQLSANRDEYYYNKSRKHAERENISIDEIDDIPKLSNICCCWGFRKYDDQIPAPMFGFDKNKVRKNWKIFLLALSVGVISLFNSLIGLLNIDTVYLLLSSIFCALLMILLFFLLIDTRIAKIQTFIILQNMFSISIDSATFYFYTDGEAEYPDGPHFDIHFYIIVMGVLGISLAVVGTFLYNFFMGDWNYQNVFFVTNVLYIIFSSTNIIFYKRLNVGYIPDQYFVLGGEILQVITGLWSSMPAAVMMYQLCPKGMESTVYALLAGSSNLGDSLANYQGAYILDAFNIKPSGVIGIDESKQFENLWIASLIDTLIHIIPLFFITFLIPDVSQTEKLIDDNIKIDEKDVVYTR
jgi:hypothetical protein